MKTNIIFSIENLNRELDYRIVLTKYCLSPNTRIIFAEHSFALKLLQSGLKGIYMGKDALSPVRAHDYHKINLENVKFMFINEEGMFMKGFQDEWKEELKSKIDPTSVTGQVDIFCAGEAQLRIYGELGATTSQLKVVGHPRFDLCKPMFRHYFEEEIKALKKEHGDFILFNTNFALCNHENGWYHMIADTKYNPASTSTFSSSHLKDEWTDDCFRFLHMTRAIKALSQKYPQKTVVIRPHLSESPEIYRVLFKDHTNVKVIKEGNVLPWVMACEFLVQQGCTTSLEATLAGKIVFGYYPLGTGSNTEIKIARSFAHNFERLEDLIGATENYRDYHEKHALDFSAASKNIINISRQDDFSFRAYGTHLEQYLSASTRDLRSEFHLKDYEADYQWFVERYQGKVKERDLGYTCKYSGFNAPYMKRKLDRIMDKGYQIKLERPHLVVIESE